MNMEINIEQLKTFSEEVTDVLNNLLKQLNPNARTLSDEDEKEIIEETANRIFVARESVGNKIVGLLTLIIINAQFVKKGLIEDVVVDEKYRGKGVGTKLVARAINQAREEGVKYIDLTSNSTKVAANKFYQHLGFKIRDTNVYRIEL